MDAALLGMIAALLAAVLASVFDQRRESGKTRDAIQLLSIQVAALTATSTAQGQQLTDLKRDAEKRHDELRQDFTDLKRDAEKRHDELRQDFTDLKRDAEKRHDELRQDFTDHGRTCSDNHRTTQEQLGGIASSLGNGHERLARIEGHLTMGASSPGEAEASA